MKEGSKERSLKTLFLDGSFAEKILFSTDPEDMGEQSHGLTVSRGGTKDFESIVNAREVKRANLVLFQRKNCVSTEKHVKRSFDDFAKVT